MTDDNDAVDDFGRTCLHRMCQYTDPPIGTIIALCDAGLRVDKLDMHLCMPFEYLTDDAMREIAARRPDLAFDFWTSYNPEM